MRRIKVLGNEPGTYHVISRVVAGERLLQSKDREVLRKQMRRMAGFCGVEILTYCILTNHFHLLIRVPPKRDLPDKELVRRYAILYGEDEAKVLEEDLKSGSRGDGRRQSLLKRMHDLSFYMKELKLRFTLYYNRNHDRFGTLWAEKFKSLLVENDDYAVKMVAAYIDLNAVRAGLCEDPKDYRFCGYAEAVAGSGAAREGLLGVLSCGGHWARCAREYRMILFGAGVKGDPSKAATIEPGESRKVLEAGGKLSLRELLRCRFRYFSEGLALGSAAFVSRLRREHPGFEARQRPGKPPSVPIDEEPDLCFARRARKI